MYALDIGHKKEYQQQPKIAKSLMKGFTRGIAKGVDMGNVFNQHSHAVESGVNIVESWKHVGKAMRRNAALAASGRPNIFKRKKRKYNPTKALDIMIADAIAKQNISLDEVKLIKILHMGKGKVKVSYETK